MREPGRQQGVRRYQRYGQLALDCGRTLDPAYVLSIKGEPVEVLGELGPVIPDPPGFAVFGFRSRAEVEAYVRDNMQ